MVTVDHYMVDFEDESGAVRFANDAHLQDLKAAKELARATSKTHGSAAVVAFERSNPGQFVAVGHVMFVGGDQSSTDGVTA